MIHLLSYTSPLISKYALFSSISTCIIYLYILSYISSSSTSSSYFIYITSIPIFYAWIFFFFYFFFYFLKMIIKYSLRKDSTTLSQAPWTTKQLVGTVCTRKLKHTHIQSHAWRRHNIAYTHQKPTMLFSVRRRYLSV